MAFRKRRMFRPRPRARVRRIARRRSRGRRIRTYRMSRGGIRL